MKEVVGGFSHSGRYYAEINVNGKLNVWDTNAGDLQHEYSPSGHLSASISCVQWIQMDNTDVMCVGTQKGFVEFYNVASGSVMSKINTQSKTVKSIYLSGQYLYTGSDDGSVAKYCLKNNVLEIKKKLGKMSALAVMGDERVLTASREIKLWNYPSGELVHKFIGHKNEIFSLHIVEADKCYLLTSARDRFINIWSLSDLKPEPLATLISDDDISSVYVYNSRNNITVTVTTESGMLHVYHHVLNGCVAYPLKPQGTLQIAADCNKGEEAKQMPIVSSKIFDSRVFIAYGTRPFLAFENMDLNKLNKSMYLARQDPRKSKSVMSAHVVRPNMDDVKFNEQKKIRSSANLPLETRLQNMSEEIENTVQTKGESIVHLLVQGLRSNDKSLLESALFVKDERTIDNTVSRLPLQSINLLVQKLIRLSQDRTSVSSISVRWLISILRIHASVILVNPNILETFLPLEDVLGTRLSNFKQLGLLDFKLKALVDKLNNDKRHKEEREALLVYNDSDDGDKRTTDEEDAMDIDLNGDKKSEASDFTDEEMDGD
ncbi:WD repeat-containing protein 43 [Adelges cooleyi]|uniref:WD repeat-containing protein 43 n=1 Tax=Adelges cooleyi TaxID=133065 RepID=UPI00218077F9|nr:WD repeat-containing protein 43 [Adelges cooleyi]